MRSIFLVSLAVVGAVSCGGAEKAPNAPAPAAPATPAASAAPDMAPPPATASPAASAVAPNPPAAPASTLVSNGNLDGTPFVAVSAAVGAAFPGYAAVSLTTYDRPCKGWDTPQDNRMVTIFLPWKEGGTVDLGGKVELNWGSKTSREPAVTAMRQITSKLPPKNGVSGMKTVNKPIAGFKPTGSATFVKGPSGDSGGRLKVDLTAGGLSIKGEIDVSNCNMLKPQ